MYKKILDKLDYLLISVAASLFFIIFAVSIAEIFCRSLLGFSLLWPVDLCTILASWTMLLGGAVLVHRNDHLIVDFLVVKAPPKFRRVLAILVNLMVLAFFGLLFFVGLQSADAKMNMRFTTIGWRMGISFYALPVSAFFSILFMFQRLFELLKGDQKNEQQRDSSI